MSVIEIKALVERCASERQLQSVMKRDLSLIGPMCTSSSLRDEYIVFSEFLVGSGCADFVVFTDRSRMAIVFVEVKGADFNFLGKDGGVSSRINRAAQQIRERFAYVEQNDEPFRRYVHSLRRDVEQGVQRFNSLLGPKGDLEVDPEKDIRLQGIVIGGRTNNEHRESQERHRLERETPRIKFESWDSCLRNNT